ncbi:hypothetical protein H2198_007983 [Neophaeococcomyces mojaviensis]|uniref:Uncharacterized protein n=1 Tax=Neophaeococcomyces mojaviensis TaxID=3383035 RepID=A0ACC2ZYR2_9EURO|nr:hypothetical protein H2198_007983 [Knufia sp. JES_112]
MTTGYLRSSQPMVTSKPKLGLRDTNTICGYWSESAITHTVQCDSDVPCVFADVNTQAYGYCTHSGAQLITKGFDYGAWPAGGCQPGQLCCNSNLPSYGAYIFNDGASSFFDCGSTRFYQTAATVLAAVSTSALTTSASASTSPRTSTPPTSTISKITSSTLSSSSTSTHTTSSSSVTSPSTANLNTNNTQNNKSDELSIGAIAGIVIGVVVGIILLAAAIIVCLRRRKHKGRTDTFLQMHPADWNGTYANHPAQFHDQVHLAEHDNDFLPLNRPGNNGMDMLVRGR